ncbi:Crustacean cardioactive peptide [Trinorchestia longiramus]|nr:Crustacean cardioactive peptide [Trinorchestia longiramus]
MDSRGMTSARLLILLTVAVVMQSSPSSALRDRSLDEGFVLKNKRPFCNAFTGCGRKRSGGGGDADQATGMEVKDQIDEIARHILGQDRMLEQLQQKVELMRALACGYPEIPTQPPYRRRRDVQEKVQIPSTASFPGYIATPHVPKRYDPTERAQASYYYASERPQKRETRRKDESTNEHDDVRVKSRRSNHDSDEDVTDLEARYDGVNGVKQGRNKSVSDQE